MIGAPLAAYCPLARRMTHRGSPGRLEPFQRALTPASGSEDRRVIGVSERYDVIVIGLGGMGSASAYPSWKRRYPA